MSLHVNTWRGLLILSALLLLLPPVLGPFVSVGLQGAVADSSWLPDGTLATSRRDRGGDDRFAQGAAVLLGVRGVDARPVERTASRRFSRRTQSLVATGRREEAQERGKEQKERNESKMSVLERNGKGSFSEAESGALGKTAESVNDSAGEDVDWPSSPHVASRDGEQQDIVDWANGALLNDEQAKNPQAPAAALSASARTGISSAERLLRDSGESESSAREVQGAANFGYDASADRREHGTQTEGARNKREEVVAKKREIPRGDETAQAVIALLEKEREHAITQKREVLRDDSTAQAFIALAETEKESERENARTKYGEIRVVDHTNEALMALLESEREIESVESEDDEGLVRVEAESTQKDEKELVHSQAMRGKSIEAPQDHQKEEEAVDVRLNSIKEKTDEETLPASEKPSKAEDRKVVDGADTLASRTITKDEKHTEKVQEISSQGDEIRSARAANSVQDNEQETDEARARQEATGGPRKDQLNVALDAGQVWHETHQLQKVADYWKTRAEHAERSLRDLQADSARIRTAVDRERVMSRDAMSLKQSKINALLRQRSAESQYKKVALYQSRLLKKMLTEDNRMMREITKSADTPDIMVWLRRRMDRIANYLDSQGGEGAGGYWKRFREEGSTEFSEIGRNLGKSIPKVITREDGPFESSFMTFMLVGIPPAVALIAHLLFTKRMSVGQFVLLGNVVSAIFMLSMCMIGIILRDDPLRSLYSISKDYFLGVNWVLAIWYILFGLLLGAALYRSCNNRDTYILAAKLLLYLFVGEQYYRNVWWPAMLGIGITITWPVYVSYLGIFYGMIFMTPRDLEHRNA